MDAMTGMCPNLIHVRLVWTQEDRLGTTIDGQRRSHEELLRTVFDGGGNLVAHRGGDCC